MLFILFLADVAACAPAKLRDCLLDLFIIIGEKEAKASRSRNIE